MTVSFSLDGSFAKREEKASKNQVKIIKDPGENNQKIEVKNHQNMQGKYGLKIQGKIHKKNPEKKNHQTIQEKNQQKVQGKIVKMRKKTLPIGSLLALGLGSGSKSMVTT